MSLLTCIWLPGAPLAHPAHMLEAWEGELIASSPLVYRQSILLVLFLAALAACRHSVTQWLRSLGMRAGATQQRHLCDHPHDA